MEVIYRADKDVPCDKLLDLYRIGNYNTWWTERNVRAWLNHCYLFITAWSGVQIVGTASAVSDGVNYAHIEDVLVHPSFRRKGIGTTMMKMILERLQPLNLDFVQLTPIPGREPFFEQLGFQVVPDCHLMEWVVADKK